MTDLTRPEGAEPSTTTPLTPNQGSELEQAQDSREISGEDFKYATNALVVSMRNADVRLGYFALTDEDEPVVVLIGRAERAAQLTAAYEALDVTVVYAESFDPPLPLHSQSGPRADVSPLPVPASPPGTPTTGDESEPRTEREDSREALIDVALQASMVGAEGGRMARAALAALIQERDELKSSVAGLSADVTRLERELEMSERRHESQRKSTAAYAQARAVWISKCGAAEVRVKELEQAFKTEVRVCQARTKMLDEAKDQVSALTGALKVIALPWHPFGGPGEHSNETCAICVARAALATLTPSVVLASLSDEDASARHQMMGLKGTMRSKSAPLVDE